MCWAELLTVSLLSSSLFSLSNAENDQPAQRNWKQTGKLNCKLTELTS